MTELTRVALDLLRLYGPLALCLFTFLESSMLFPFLPSEAVVPAAAAVLVVDIASLVVFVAAASLGGVVGALVPFLLFARTRIGRSRRLREALHVSETRAEWARTWFRRWGESSVLWGRFLPVLRSVISVPAGVAGMDTARFTLFTAIGSLGFYAATAALVYYGRQQSLFSAAVAAAAANPLLAVGLAALAALALFALSRRQDWSE